MCRACRKDFPTPKEYRAFVCASADLADQVQDDGLRPNDPQFRKKIRALDSLRFSRNPDWGNRKTSQSTRKCIFERCDAQKALTLFVLTNCYNIQEPYPDVWTKRLEDLSTWIDIPNRRKKKRNLPGARFRNLKAPTAWKTWKVCGSGGFAAWFAKTVIEIAAANPNGTGNVRRFVAALALELMCLGKESRRIAKDCLDHGQYAHARLKRAWLVTMCLRRDKGMIKCLVQRALREKGKRGTRAFKLWYDGENFLEIESELPIDRRMHEIGSKLFNQQSLQGIARAAHCWGNKHNLAPSTLDALFFSMD